MNHIAPSGPAAIPYGEAPGEMPLASSTVGSAAAMRPTLFPLFSVNHSMTVGARRDVEPSCSMPAFSKYGL